MSFLSKANKAPTTQVFTSTNGGSAGILFKISTSSTVAVGDTYTTGGFTYTVLGALAAQTGWVLFCSGNTSLSINSAGTLTRASGAGTASITFTDTAVLQTYTTPGGCRYLRIKGVGGGQGGSGSGTSSNNGHEGGPTTFGVNLIKALGGSTPSAGGIASIASPAYGTALNGNKSGGAFFTPNANYKAIGVAGAPSRMGSGAIGGDFGAVGQNADANTGGGGSGGGAGLTASIISDGGSSGAYVDCYLPSPLSATYVICVGAAGFGGSAGTSGFAGGDGGSGYLEVTEYY